VSLGASTPCCERMLSVCVCVCVFAAGPHTHTHTHTRARAHRGRDTRARLRTRTFTRHWLAGCRRSPEKRSVVLTPPPPPPPHPHPTPLLPFLGQHPQGFERGGGAYEANASVEARAIPNMSQNMHYPRRPLSLYLSLSISLSPSLSLSLSI